MKNPLFDRRHFKEYIGYGAIATIVYVTMLMIFLLNSKYENLYLVYIGNFLFIAVIGYYTLTLVKRQYEGKRAVSMLVAGHLALIAGIILSIISVIICVAIFHPALFTAISPNELLEGAPPSVSITHPTGLIFLLEANIILVSGGASSFLVVIFSYAAKRNQTKDKPASLAKHIVSHH